MARIISYNCNSVRNNAEIVKSLLLDADILVLQEIMLEKSDINILGNFNNNFRYAAFVNDREREGICEGRPSGGVAIFWRAELAKFVSPLYVNNFLIGVTLSTSNYKILLLNVYMPCDMQTADALYKYKQSLAILGSVITEQNFNHVILVGDFNADPRKGRFWRLLRDFVDSLSLLVLDNMFPPDTFTYLCPSRDSTSWLDHVICSPNIKSKISKMSVSYDYALFDHFPIYFHLDVVFDVPIICNDNILCEFVKWDRLSDEERLSIKNYIDRESVNIVDDAVFSCCNQNCKSQQHKDKLSELFITARYILYHSTDEYRFIKDEKFKEIPGWNDYVRQHHWEAREKFLLWVSNGKPYHGILYEDMKSTRSLFKAALDMCKSNENDIRNKKMLENFMNKNFKYFWSDVHRTMKNNVSLPMKIDGCCNKEEIVNIFSAKYKDILNKNENIQNMKAVNISEKKKVEILLRFSVSDISKCILMLKDNIGFDKIHSNHLKIQSHVFNELLANLFTSFLMHSYLPSEMIYGIITPIIKDKFGDVADSENYRPIMSSSVMLKLFEYCILTKIEPFITLNDRQHGFRKKYSTTTACFALKETVMLYNNGNSDVYASFIDFRKAFDSVDHNILIQKLHKIGLPDNIVRVIAFWYDNQMVRVRFNSCLSGEWKLSNGVRQGGVLSGLFFSIYINDLIDKISSMDVGCKMDIVRANIVAYADDVVLLAPSARALQLLLEVGSCISGGLCIEIEF